MRVYNGLLKIDLVNHTLVSSFDPHSHVYMVLKLTWAKSQVIVEMDANTTTVHMKEYGYRKYFIIYNTTK